jgi:hypothetical protein
MGEAPCQQGSPRDRSVAIALGRELALLIYDFRFLVPIWKSESPHGCVAQMLEPGSATRSKIRRAEGWPRKSARFIEGDVAAARRAAVRPRSARLIFLSRTPLAPPDRAGCVARRKDRR